MFSGILGNLFKAREKVAQDIIKRRRRLEDPDYDPDNDYDDEEKPFLDHLEDLRKTIMRVMLTLIAGIIICFCFYKLLISFIFQPIENAGLATIEWVKTEDGKDGGFRLIPFEGKEEESAVPEVSPEVEIPVPDPVPTPAIDPPSPVQEEITALSKRVDVLEGKVPDDPHADTGLRIVALGVPEAFMSALKVCFLGAVTLTFPFNLYFLLQFILPGLKAKEKRLLWPSLAIGTGLFLLGVAFSYWVALPRVLTFFYAFSQGMGVESDFRLVEYIKFSTRLILLFGLCFELPVVVMALVKLDILNYTSMSRTRGYAVVIIFVVAAIITPTPDAATLILLALPMVLLYEICIWLAYFIEKKERRLHPELYEEYDDQPKAAAGLEPTDGSASQGGSGEAKAWDEDPGHPWHDDGQSDSAAHGEDGSEDPDHGHYQHEQPSGPGYTRSKLMRMRKSELQEISETMGLGTEGTKEWLTDMILDHQDLW